MKNLIMLALIITVLGVTVLPVRGDNDDLYLIRVKPIDFQEALHKFKTVRMLDVAGISVADGIIDIVVKETTYHAIAMEYKTTVVLSPDQIREMRVDPEYKDPEEVRAILSQVALDYPNVTKLLSIGQSFEGRDILAIKISDNPQVDENEPTILFNGQHHAREVMACEVPLDIIEYLCSMYGTDPEVTAWVNAYEIWVVPQVNPDGVNHVFEMFDMWRKDRTINPSSDCLGIDPNRNYPVFFGECDGSSDDPCSNTYRGPAPRESACVDHMMNFVSGIRPVIDVSYHSFGEYVGFPYGCEGLLTPDHNVLLNIGSTMASLIEKDDGAGSYLSGVLWQMEHGSVAGCDIDWQYQELGTFAFIVELNSFYQGFLPPYSWRDSTVERNRPGWQYLLRCLEGPAITGTVRDACDPEHVIPGAEVKILENPLTSIENPRTSDAFGSFYRLTEPGEYHVEISAPGYATTLFSVEVGKSRFNRDFFLVPSGSYGVILESVEILDEAGVPVHDLIPGETMQLRMHFTAVGDLTTVTANLSSTSTYLNITDSHAAIGSIADGQTGTTLSPHFICEVDSNCPSQEVVSFEVSVFADQELCVFEFQYSPTISSYVYTCPVFEDNMDTDPYWEIANSGPDGWEFGGPSGTPSSAYSGQYCYGTNLDGNHGICKEYILTSSPFDCSEMAGTQLRFYRYLNMFNWTDNAYIWVTGDDGVWHYIWSGYETDSEWTEVVYDLSAFADGQSMVRVRWELQVNSINNAPGFYIDDVSICGNTAPAATPTPTPTPNPVFRASLNLNQNLFHPGDTFTLKLSADNNTSQSLDLDQYLLLDVYNNYFFHPAWMAEPDCSRRQFNSGDSVDEIILEFDWPNSQSEASGLRFWLGYCQHNTVNITGDISWVDFGYTF